MQLLRRRRGPAGANGVPPPWARGGTPFATENTGMYGHGRSVRLAAGSFHGEYRFWPRDGHARRDCIGCGSNQARGAGRLDILPRRRERVRHLRGQRKYGARVPPPSRGPRKNVATFRGQTFASKDRRDGFRAAAAVRSFSSTTKGMRMIRRVERRHGGAPWVPVRV